MEVPADTIVVAQKGRRPCRPVGSRGITVGAEGEGGNEPMSTTSPQEMVIGGRYRVIRILGKGGMGAVYEAENLRTRRRVAIKTMRPEVASRAEFARRFELEAQAAGQLRHPNIVDVLDLGDDPEQQLVFLVQEFLSGGDLGRCLKTVRSLGVQPALATLLPIMDALSVAHVQGIVHRDLKPDNIFLHETPQGVVPKLIDFGIAKFLDRVDDQSRTATGAVVGSPTYMSPEQARGDTSLDARTDVWSMGVVFYEALTGRQPYTATTVNLLLVKIIGEEPTPIATLAPHLPADIARAVQRAVTRDRDARWPSMVAFADALRGCEAWRGVDERDAHRWVVNAVGASLEAAPLSDVVDASVEPVRPASSTSGVSSGLRSGSWAGEVTSDTRPKWSGRSRLALVGVGVLAIAATVGAVVGRSSRRPSTPTASAPVTAVLRAAAPVVAAPVVATPVVADGGARERPRPGRHERSSGRHPALQEQPGTVGTAPAAPPPARGFNGARIIE